MALALTQERHGAKFIACTWCNNFASQEPRSEKDFPWRKTQLLSIQPGVVITSITQPPTIADPNSHVCCTQWPLHTRLALTNERAAGVTWRSGGGLANQEPCEPQVESWEEESLSLGFTRICTDLRITLRPSGKWNIHYLPIVWNTIIYSKKGNFWDLIKQDMVELEILFADKNKNYTL